MGRVCDKHGEWCPTGECRWCEPVGALEPEGLNGLIPEGFFGIDNQPLVFNTTQAGSLRPRLGYREWHTPLPALALVEERIQDAMNLLWAKLAAED